jgi:hypothetical protein
MTASAGCVGYIDGTLLGFLFDGGLVGGGLVGGGFRDLLRFRDFPGATPRSLGTRVCLLLLRRHIDRMAVRA